MLVVGVALVVTTEDKMKEASIENNLFSVHRCCIVFVIDDCRHRG